MAQQEFGYAAMLEQFHPRDLIEYCVAAEENGFSGVMAADHLQPWVPAQGNAAFVWAFMAAVAERTKGGSASSPTLEQILVPTSTIDWCISRLT